MPPAARSEARSDVRRSGPLPRPLSGGDAAADRVPDRAQPLRRIQPDGLSSAEGKPAAVRPLTRRAPAARASTARTDQPHQRCHRHHQPRCRRGRSTAPQRCQGATDPVMKRTAGVPPRPSRSPARTIAAQGDHADELHRASPFRLIDATRRQTTEGGPWLSDCSQCGRPERC